MSKNLLRPIGFCLFLAIPGVTSAEEYRCGWLENPSPGNQWLIDKDGVWTIAKQGASSAVGLELIEREDNSEFVDINYGYGYSCACIRVEANPETQLIKKIYEYKQLSLKQCLDDDSIRERHIRLSSPGDSH